MAEQQIRQRSWSTKIDDRGVISVEYGAAVGCLIMATVRVPGGEAQTIAEWLTDEQRRELAGVLVQGLLEEIDG
jgi:hypothetical protein